MKTRLLIITAALCCCSTYALWGQNIRLMDLKKATYDKNVTDVIFRWWCVDQVYQIEKFSLEELNKAKHKLEAAIKYHNDFKTSKEMQQFRAYHPPLYGSSKKIEDDPIEKFVADYDKGTRVIDAQAHLDKINSLISGATGAVAPTPETTASQISLSAKSEPKTPTKEEIDRYSKELEEVIKKDEGADVLDVPKCSMTKIKEVEKLLKAGADPKIISTSFFEDYSSLIDPSILTSYFAKWAVKKMFRPETNDIVLVASKEFLAIVELLLEAGGCPPLTNISGSPLWSILLESRNELLRGLGLRRITSIEHFPNGDTHVKAYSINVRSIFDMPTSFDRLLQKLLRAQLAFEVGESGIFGGSSSHIDEYIKKAKEFFDVEFVKNCLNDPYPYPDTNEYPNSPHGKNVKDFTPVELAAKNGHPNCLEVMLKAKDKEGKPLVTVGTAEKALKKIPSDKVPGVKNLIKNRQLEKCKNMLSAFINKHSGATKPQPKPEQSTIPVPGQ